MFDKNKSFYANFSSTLDDEIILNYKKITYIYKITKIWEIEKTGTISVEKENSTQLILTTCSKTSQSKQLIINCIKKV